MPNETSKRLETYELTIREMTLDDVDKLHELSITVRWPHRPKDWRMLLTVGKGVVGCDAIGRIVASGMWFPIGDGCATIGMVITSPRLQALGGGRWIMKHIMAQCEGRDILLTSTRAGYRLYQSLDFQTVTPVYQHQGIAKPVDRSSLSANDGLREITSADTQSIIELDNGAFGADRSHIIETILEMSQGFVLEQEGRIVGFALCRQFGRGHVIGPVVAHNLALAMSLITPHINQHAGHFLRIDTTEQNSTFKDFLIKAGMNAFDTVTSMKSPSFNRLDNEYHSFALASHTLG